jgi:hypothetical protein
VVSGAFRPADTRTLFQTREGLASPKQAAGDFAMKKDQVKLGGTYLAKVSGKVVPVRLDAESPHGGWQAFNLETHKTVRIKSAQRLRGPAKNNALRRMAEVAAEAQQAQTAAESNKAPKEKKAKQPQEPKTKKVSGLDAAFNVLVAKGEPMTCKAIVDEMLTKGLWSTNGKTPAATIYSAMLREIDGKPAESRFAKTGRGLFAAVTPKSAKA